MTSGLSESAAQALTCSHPVPQPPTFEVVYKNLRGGWGKGPGGGPHRGVLQPEGWSAGNCPSQRPWKGECEQALGLWNRGLSAPVRNGLSQKEHHEWQVILQWSPGGWPGATLTVQEAVSLTAYYARRVEGRGQACPCCRAVRRVTASDV
eukprot:6468499-Amphidinium_carterae.7